LTSLATCNPGQPWWRKSDLVGDLCYWFLIPVFARFARIGLAVLLTVYLLGIRDGNTIARYFAHGHGPLSQLPLLAQSALYLVAADFFHYWVHRLFHRGWMWKYHAVHHAPTELDWTSAARFHPFNLLADSILVDVSLLMCGISPNIFLVVGPFTTFSSALVHANLSWTFGPLKYVFASPVFHRWHHTLPDEGGERNFGGTFSLFDVIFGTFYMPEGRRPSRYGVDASIVPASIALPALQRR
jgi:sterol desaturase/sphingolipid hydroxylase (fatty acid hydroxylase superfamily)